jgi:hypothetical protein
MLAKVRKLENMAFELVGAFQQTIPQIYDERPSDDLVSEAWTRSSKAVGQALLALSILGLLIGKKAGSEEFGPFVELLDELRAKWDAESASEDEPGKVKGVPSAA